MPALLRSYIFVLKLDVFHKKIHNFIAINNLNVCNKHMKFQRPKQYKENK